MGRAAQNLHHQIIARLAEPQLRRIETRRQAQRSAWSCVTGKSIDDSVLGSVRGCAKEIEVIATTTNQGVSARPPIQDVVAGIAGEDVVKSIAAGVEVTRPCQGQVLDLLAGIGTGS